MSDAFIFFSVIFSVSVFSFLSFSISHSAFATSVDSTSASSASIRAAQKESTDIINSFDRHKANLAAYDQILKELDPSYAKTREQDEEIKRLNKELADLKGLIKSVPTLNDIKSLLKPETPKTK